VLREVAHGARLGRGEAAGAQRLVGEGENGRRIGRARLTADRVHEPPVDGGRGPGGELLVGDVANEVAEVRPLAIGQQGAGPDPLDDGPETGVGAASAAWASSSAAAPSGRMAVLTSWR
jgi:hypothetical protein